MLLPRMTDTFNHLNMFVTFYFKKEKRDEIPVVIGQVPLSHPSRQRQQKLTSLAGEVSSSVLLLVLPLGGLERIPWRSDKQHHSGGFSALHHRPRGGVIFWGLTSWLKLP